ncbi:aspartate/glutamate racemase family protein [Paracoccus albus]|uniref:aspartate/glutamate racemase family protein n=1 Tax=Paracoccus albus TaxID=3017784 RepID=UPI0022EFE7FA|nr:aspartate/glutamate racemase family protein [Paracoccus albus]WBU59301.1 aspartate/glutamate racemase family protein [Paracoccus albus]
MSGFIGVLSLDTRFPRIAGDAGNPGSYHIPARIRIVEGADSPLIVRDGRPSAALAERFIAAARDMEGEGAILITSTCGFLISMQDEIAQAVRIPVMLSALSMVAQLQAAQPDQVIGILTASAASLGPNALAAARIDPPCIRIMGLDHMPEFSRVFLAPKSLQPNHFDRAAMQAAVICAGRQLIRSHPEVTTVLLECGNLPPYAQALAQAIDRPVLSILDGAKRLTRQN